MSNIAMQMPFIRAEGPTNNPPSVMKDAVTEAAAQAWLAGSLVQTTGAVGAITLQVCAAAATLIYGQSPDAAKGTTTNAALLKPPFALFGLDHYCFDLRDRILEINISAGSLSGADIGSGGATWDGTTGGVALAPGQQYGIATLTSGTYNKYQVLNISNTTQKVFEIVALATTVGGIAQAIGDHNPRVWVKVIPTAIQG